MIRNEIVDLMLRNNFHFENFFIGLIDWAIPAFKTFTTNSEKDAEVKMSIRVEFIYINAVAYVLSTSRERGERNLFKLVFKKSKIYTAQSNQRRGWKFCKISTVGGFKNWYFDIFLSSKNEFLRGKNRMEGGRRVSNPEPSPFPYLLHCFRVKNTN